MVFFIEHIRKRLGWCPNIDSRERPPYAKTKSVDVDAGIGRSPGSGPVPESAGIAGKDRPGYQENILLILIAIAWLFPVFYGREILPISILLILSAVVMYCDAQNIGAGSGFEKESLFGDVVAWRPLTWGAATLVGGIIIMAIYLFHRREIYNANWRTGSPVGSIPE